MHATSATSAAALSERACVAAEAAPTRVLLIAGDAGMGSSTLAAQTAALLAHRNRVPLYTVHCQHAAARSTAVAAAAASSSAVGSGPTSGTSMLVSSSQSLTLDDVFAQLWWQVCGWERDAMRDARLMGDPSALDALGVLGGGLAVPAHVARATLALEQQQQQQQQHACVTIDWLRRRRAVTRALACGGVLLLDDCECAEWLSALRPAELHDDEAVMALVDTRARRSRDSGDDAGTERAGARGSRDGSDAPADASALDSDDADDEAHEARARAASAGADGGEAAGDAFGPALDADEAAARAVRGVDICGRPRRRVTRRMRMALEGVAEVPRLFVVVTARCADEASIAHMAARLARATRAHAVATVDVAGDECAALRSTLPELFAHVSGLQGVDALHSSPEVAELSRRFVEAASWNPLGVRVLASSLSLGRVSPLALLTAVEQVWRAALPSAPALDALLARVGLVCAGALGAPARAMLARVAASMPHWLPRDDFADVAQARLPRARGTDADADAADGDGEARDALREVLQCGLVSERLRCASVHPLLVPRSAVGDDVRPYVRHQLVRLLQLAKLYGAARRTWAGDVLAESPLAEADALLVREFKRGASGGSADMWDALLGGSGDAGDGGDAESDAVLGAPPGSTSQTQAPVTHRLRRRLLTFYAHGVAALDGALALGMAHVLHGVLALALPLLCAMYPPAHLLRWYAGACALFAERGMHGARVALCMRRAVLLDACGDVDAALAALAEASDVLSARVQPLGKGDLLPAALHARMLLLRGALLLRSGALRDARRALVEAVGVAREHGLEAAGVCLLGESSLELREYVRAADLFDKTVSLSTASGDRAMLNHGVLRAAQIAVRTGNHSLALDLYTQSLALVRGTLARSAEALATFGCGCAYAALGDNARALERLSLASELALDSGAAFVQGRALFALALSVARNGEVDLAQQLLEESELSVDARVDPELHARVQLVRLIQPELAREPVLLDANGALAAIVAHVERLSAFGLDESPLCVALVSESERLLALVEDDAAADAAFEPSAELCDVVCTAATL